MQEDNNEIGKHIREQNREKQEFDSGQQNPDSGQMHDIAKNRRKQIREKAKNQIQEKYDCFGTGTHLDDRIGKKATDSGKDERADSGKIEVTRFGKN